MLKPFTITRHQRSRWLYPLISITLTLSIVLSSTIATLAIPLPELIFRGIQVIQLSNLSARQEAANKLIKNYSQNRLNYFVTKKLKTMLTKLVNV